MKYYFYNITYYHNTTEKFIVTQYMFKSGGGDIEKLNTTDNIWLYISDKMHAYKYHFI